MFSLNLETNEKREVWHSEVINFDENLYQTDRIKISVRDETEVPNSLIYKKGIDLQNSSLINLWLWILWKYY